MNSGKKNLVSMHLKSWPRAEVPNLVMLDEGSFEMKFFLLHWRRGFPLNIFFKKKKLMMV